MSGSGEHELERSTVRKLMYGLVVVIGDNHDVLVPVALMVPHVAPLHLYNRSIEALSSPISLVVVVTSEFVSNPH